MPPTAKSPTAKLALEDGTVMAGLSLGAQGEVDGEVCFNTSMTGYQEILTDPSYRGQIVAMTYPEIGNYGVNSVDLESARPQLSGFIVRNRSRQGSNFRSEGSLEEYLARHNIVGIAGVDTRALVRKLRQFGSMKGVVSTADLDDASLVAKAKASPGLVGRDLAREVMPCEARAWSERLDPLMTFAGMPLSGGQPHGADAAAGTVSGGAPSAGASSAPGRHGAAFNVVALDFGMKWNIPRYLTDSGFNVTILPGSASAEEVLAQRPDGVFLSNGPGDPEPLDYAIQTIRGLLGRTPIFGICLGHQLLSLACGAKTFKLKFGHRGANQPVQNLLTGRVEITSQNHGFAVLEDNLPPELEVTHRNLNDRTIEGIRHREAPAFCVQYHPEASAGPHDSAYLFHEFRQLIAGRI